MVDSLTQTFNNLCEKIIRLKKRDQPIGEANTKATLIEPLLAALGWNITNIDEVVREFRLSQRYDVDVGAGLIVPQSGIRPARNKNGPTLRSAPTT
ncbi:unnamed protein product [marine sediment metagenome]|uniref:Uncharacterized protein n=1 Tax=marine sediment metagenome TaxID=412755 RepID=X1NJV5_9ZZZZ